MQEQEQFSLKIVALRISVQLWLDVREQPVDPVSIDHLQCPLAAVDRFQSACNMQYDAGSGG